MEKPAAARLFQNVEFEVFPAKGVFDKVVEHFPRGATMTIASSPTRGVRPTLRLHRLLTSAGYRSIPHLAARVIASEEQLTEVLQELEATNTTSIFVVGGDPKKPSGPFDSAAQLLEAIWNRGHGFESVGVAGYPQGHPTIGRAALEQAMREKQRYATSVVTQICFEARAIARWAEALRQEGIPTPVYVGVPGPMQGASLLSFALKCGVADAGGFLKSHLGLVGRLLRPSYSPNGLLDDLADLCKSEDTGISGLHVFTFNQIEQAAAWAQPFFERRSMIVAPEKP